MTESQYSNHAQRLASTSETSVHAPELNPEAKLAAVRAALAGLEATGSPEAIADFLGSADVYGRPGIACDCPISNYVFRATGVRIAVTNHWWQFHGWPLVVTDETDRTMPPNVSEFISLFDVEAYHALIDPNPNTAYEAFLND